VRQVARGARIASALSPGDTLEYSLTAEIKSPKTGNWWIKMGGSTTIRANESAPEAQKRLTEFVHNALDERAQELLQH
jgi:hypothetical protein